MAVSRARITGTDEGLGQRSYTVHPGLQDAAFTTNPEPRPDPDPDLSSDPNPDLSPSLGPDLNPSPGPGPADHTPKRTTRAIPITDSTGSTGSTDTTTATRATRAGLGRSRSFRTPSEEICSGASLLP